MEKYKEIELKLTLVVKSIMGITEMEIAERILEMELEANRNGDPRFHFTSCIIFANFLHSVLPND